MKRRRGKDKTKKNTKRKTVQNRKKKKIFRKEDNPKETELQFQVLSKLLGGKQKLLQISLNPYTSTREGHS